MYQRNPKSNNYERHEHDNSEVNCPHCLSEGNTTIMDRLFPLNDDMIYLCPACDTILTEKELNALYEKIYEPLIGGDHERTDH